MARNDPFVIEPHDFDELKRWVLQARHSIAILMNRLASLAVRRHEANYKPFAVHRGVTDGAINKNASGTVSRYTPGTTTDSGENDTVENEYANVGSGKKVAYIRNGDKFYMIAAECPLT